MAFGSREIVISKLLVMGGIYSAAVFLKWLYDDPFGKNGLLYSIILITLSYKVIIHVIEWLLVWHPSVPEKPTLKRSFTVDVLTTYVKGEPKELIKESLMAIKSITYPHESFLCDEADDPELKSFCAKNNIHHVTREKKIDAKAGNINNALQSRAKGEIVLILDPDHIVYPDFLDEVLPFFEDDQIGYVQVVQAYSNQYSTVIAKAAAEQTYQFYGPVMMTLNSYGAVPAIGANCTFRRSALDSIGGHAPGLTEDMHTALRLKAKGWKSVYHPKILAKGLVPWNYSGYCLQQLKWSRGSFDLLVNVFPKVRGGLSWLEQLVFLTVPLFYLSGLISLIDFLIPIIALLVGFAPKHLDVLEFAVYFSPFLFITQIIRFYHQKWYYLEHEKGSAVLGGILAKSSWWATSLGLIYSLINKTVPYIPTPKDSRLETPWKILLPNFCIISVSLFAVVFGLVRDITPFTLFFALLASLNVLILSFGCLMAMQKQIVAFHDLFRGSFISKGSSTRMLIYRVKHVIYNLLHRNAMATGLIVLFVLLNLVVYKLTQSNISSYLGADYYRSKMFSLFGDKDAVIYGKRYGQFYAGVRYRKDAGFDQINSSFIAAKFHLNGESEVELEEFLDGCYSNNTLPFLSVFSGSTQTRSRLENHSALTLERIFSEIKKRYLPVIVMLNRAPDEASEDSYSEYYEQAYMLADSMAVNKLITWVWHADGNEFSPDFVYYNPHEILDWIYAENVKTHFYKDKYYVKPWTGVGLPFLINDSNVEQLSDGNFRNNSSAGNVVGILGGPCGAEARLDYNLNESFSKLVHKNVNRLGLPDYVKGVAYNPGFGGDNCDDLPVSAKKLERDFGLIREMGANTVRRFSPSIYDYNLLKAARHHNLGVLYGFWFSRSVDYHKEASVVRRQKERVLRKVNRYQSDPSIVGWGLGNETWTYLRRYFGQPYLSLVRSSYLKHVSDMVNEIKLIDSNRPVFTSEIQSAADMYAVSEFIPQIDFIGINSYYKEVISQLKGVAQRNLNGIPYLVAEYGNEGFWTDAYNSYDLHGRLIEQTSWEKARDYKSNWTDYIIADKENNLGGVAFCWQDKYEGTATWFGIIDIFGNIKPSYYALKDAYSGKPEQEQLNDFPIPDFTISRCFEGVAKNKMLFKALAPRDAEVSKYEFKWIIYSTYKWDKIVETDFAIGNDSFTCNVLEKGQLYRVYLYVKDRLGNVITSSHPIVR